MRVVKVIHPDPKTSVSVCNHRGRAYSFQFQKSKHFVSFMSLPFLNEHWSWAGFCYCKPSHQWKLTLSLWLKENSCMQYKDLIWSLWLAWNDCPKFHLCLNVASLCIFQASFKLPNTESFALLDSLSKAQYVKSKQCVWLFTLDPKGVELSREARDMSQPISSEC